ncbi:MAG TPA: methyltransferase domain-containing protein [Bacillota bacterium]|nr:methyltransferase domain-containing protein [Bacillota bacterium]
MTENNRDAVRAQFGARAHGYAESPGHAAGADLRLLIEGLPTGPGLTALDVATGTGHTALALAPRVGDAVGLDLTPEMLAEAARLAAERGVRNVTWALGDAHALPFPDVTFDIVTTRRAAHHFANVARFLQEARRVLKPGGTLGIVDQSVPEVPEAAAPIWEMEKRRDPSHVRAWSGAEWRRMLEAASFAVESLELAVERRDVEEWLELAGSDQAGAARVLNPLLAASPAALQGNAFARDAAGRWSFDKLRVVILARAR